MATHKDSPSPKARTRADELRAEWLERMRTRDQEAFNVALNWAANSTTRLHGRLRAGDELREDPRPRLEDLPLADRVREEGGWYSPARVGVFLRLMPEELAQKAGVTVKELDEWPPGPQLQAYLEAVVAVLVKAIDAHAGDERFAAKWYLDSAVARFDGRTADEMVRAGQVPAVCEYLDALAEADG